MFKIIWNKEEKERLLSLLPNLESEQYDYVLTDDPNEVPTDKVGIVYQGDNLELLKPLLETLSIRQTQLLFTTCDGWIQLPVYEITYLESFGSEIVVHDIYHVQHTIREPLYQLEQILQPYHFVRVGKSYLVSIAKIRYIRTHWNAKLDLELIGGDHVEVSRSYVPQFKQAIGIANKEE